MNWDEIRLEYVTSDTSYRKLAAAHGVSYQAICARSRRENWVQQREQHRNKVAAESLERISDSQIERALRVQHVADRILSKVERILDSERITPSKAKQLTGVLRDVNGIYLIRPEADRAEQDARIAALQQRTLSAQHDERTIEVVFANSGADEWNE